MQDPKETALNSANSASSTTDGPLLDWSRRKIDYLRLSITDRCNERCVYCMPQGLKDWKERDQILSYEEILRVVRITIALGFRKFRVTGGEPLVRKDAVPFLKDLGGTPGVESLGLSTNATLVARHAEELVEAGIDSMNVSLDTLDPEMYRKITLKELSDAIEGIDAAIEAGMPKVKINAVLMRGKNEDQLIPLIRFAQERGAVARFIELMPLTSRDVLTKENFLSVGTARKIIGEQMQLEPIDVKLGHGPAVYYGSSEGATVGFIGAMTNLHFCDSCNKVRLTPDGKIRPCLGNHLEFDLRSVIRDGGSDRDIVDLFHKSLGLKPAEHEFRDQYKPGRHMTAIGG